MENEREKSALGEYIENHEMPGEWEFDDENQEPPQPYSWKEIDDMRFDPDRWLVKGLIPKEGITIFASISGEGKSLLIMHLSKCISEGKPWFGHEDFKTQQAKVLYINLEMSVSEMQRRGRMMGFDTQNKDLIILNEDDFNLNDADEEKDLKYKWLLNYIYQENIKVVVIDTFRASSGGLKEEKAEEVRHFFQKFLVLKNSGVSLIILEHVRKPLHLEGKAPKKEQLLGSQDKTANAEVLLMIKRDEERGTIGVYQRKNRLGVEKKPFEVRVVDVLDDNCEPLFAFEYVGEIEDDGTKKEEAKELILQILSSGEMKTRKELNALTNKEVGDKNLRAALKELENLGEIDHIKDGKQFMYFLALKGKTPQVGVLEQEDVFLFDSK